MFAGDLCTFSIRHLGRFRLARFRHECIARLDEARIVPVDARTTNKDLEATAATRHVRRVPDIKLTASDGHELDAFYLAPEGTPRGGVVVLQEIFGVNDHIRAIVAMYAGSGYAAIAPALFDRLETNVCLGYSEADHVSGIALAQKLSPTSVVLDIHAAVARLSKAGKVGVIGYCLGGALSWLSAAKVEGLAAAVSYYGAQIPMFAKTRPRIPIQFHLARRDQYFPIATARELCGAITPGEVHEYDADHGFACDHRAPVFDATASALAFQRSLRFFAENLG